jgi:hypothetical protein
MYTPLEMELAYYESELGGQLVVETSGSAYGSVRAKDHVKTITAQTLPQIGTRHTAVNPKIKAKTG